MPSFDLRTFCELTALSSVTWHHVCQLPTRVNLCNRWAYRDPLLLYESENPDAADVNGGAGGSKDGNGGGSKGGNGKAKKGGGGGKGEGSGGGGGDSATEVDAATEAVRRRLAQDDGRAAKSKKKGSKGGKQAAAANTETWATSNPPLQVGVCNDSFATTRQIPNPADQPGQHRFAQRSRSRRRSTSAASWLAPDPRSVAESCSTSMKHAMSGSHISSQARSRHIHADAERVAQTQGPNMPEGQAVQTKQCKPRNSLKFQHYTDHPIQALIEN